MHAHLLLNTLKKEEDKKKMCERGYKKSQEMYACVCARVFVCD